MEWLPQGYPVQVPERLPRELRVVYELVRAAASEADEAGEPLERVSAEIRSAFSFSRMRLRPAAETGDALLERARSERRAVSFGDAVAVPLLLGDRCLGFVVGEEPPAELGEGDLQLLTTLGLVAAVLVDRAEDRVRLERALEDLHRVDALKTDFISIASHELRAPVAVVHGITATLHLRGDLLSPQQLVELRGALFEQSTRLRELTEQLLDLSRIESGSLRMRPQRFRPREWIDALVPRIAPDRLADVAVEVEPEIELETDADAFERVLGNLLTNALKYGRPPVLVRSRAGPPFCLIVEDRGEGVAPEFVGDLFDRFTRSAETRSANRLGAGLGLAIARSFAEAIGGTLRYEPAEPHGARFVLELPPEPPPAH